MSQDSLPFRRAAIVYASKHHGNTARVAAAMADVLNADLLDANVVKPEEITGYDLIGFGSGIYFARHHKAVRRVAKTLSHPPKLAFLFSTAGLPFLSRLYHTSLRRTLVRQGCQIVGEFTCRGWDTVGPLILIGGINWFHPNKRDLRRAADFASSLRDRSSQASRSCVESGSVPRWNGPAS